MMLGPRKPSAVAWVCFLLFRIRLSIEDKADRAALRSVGFENSVTPLNRAGKA